MYRTLKGTLIFLGCALPLYLLPNLVKGFIINHMGPWIGCILWGDAVGCFVVAKVFGMRQLALLLYVALAEIESVLLTTHAVNLNQLMWITDLVPSLTAGSLAFFAYVFLADREDQPELRAT
jgi:hypothetical protein